MGAQGTQFKCYSNEATKYPPPRQPAGGGFGMEVFTLQDLYYRYKQHKSIWTTTNEYRDLCRYTGCRFTFYRHSTTDFLITYNTQPPFTLDKFTYPAIHPLNQMLQKKKRIIYSLRSKPWGGSKVTLKIHPPKQMINKWFFQKQFSGAGLCQIQAAAADVLNANMGNTWANTNISIYYLNTGFYQLSNWGKSGGQTEYKPFHTIKEPLYYWYKDRGTSKYFQYKPNQTYAQSIHYDTGYFNTHILNAYKITDTSTESAAMAMATLPIAVGRYNPQADTGVGNELWIISILTDHYDKPREPELLFSGYPLWMMFYGYYNFILKFKGDDTFLRSHMFIVRSPAIVKLQSLHQQDYFPIIDQSFLNGQMPYDEYLDTNKKNYWYPSVLKQMEIINAIVCSGPYIPKYADNRDSSWELNYKCTFYFKFGGPQITEQPVIDPQKQQDYDVPDKFKETIQIVNPITQSCETMFHDWDYRRGMLTATAIKRMSKHLRSDSDISTTFTEPPTKKIRITAEVPYQTEETKKIKNCLLSLCEEDSFQEEEDLLKLIKQQHIKQQHLKQNLLQLIADIKNQQTVLQLQTGIIS